jgi:sialate O-acetylesterase
MLSMRIAISGLVVLLVVANCSLVEAEITPHGLLTDNAVLQRGVKVPLLGTTDKAEMVTVTFAGQEVSAAPSDGKWRVELAPMEANRKPRTLTIAQGDTRFYLKNLLIGDVWLCGGQSNMAHRTLDTPESKATLPTTTN